MGLLMIKCFFCGLMVKRPSTFYHLELVVLLNVENAQFVLLLIDINVQGSQAV